MVSFSEILKHILANVRIATIMETVRIVFLSKLAMYTDKCSFVSVHCQFGTTWSYINRQSKLEIYCERPLLYVGAIDVKLLFRTLTRARLV